jgi:hypothetical protein
MRAIDILTDLLGSDAADLHGTIVYDAAGLAALVIQTLAENGYQIVQVDP